MTKYKECPTCPVKPHCKDSIKTFRYGPGAQIVIMGEPVESCPGPKNLISSLDGPLIRLSTDTSPEAGYPFGSVIARQRHTGNGMSRILSDLD